MQERYFTCCYIFGTGERVLWNRACPSLHPVFPSFGLSQPILGIVFSDLYSWNCILGIILGIVFPKFWHGARTPHEVEPDFLEKKFLPPKLGKWNKNGPKTGFFEFTEKFSHKFLLDLFSNENFILFVVFLHKSHIRVNFSPWDMGQNFLNHISRTN